MGSYPEAVELDRTPCRRQCRQHVGIATADSIGQQRQARADIAHRSRNALRVREYRFFAGTFNFLAGQAVEARKRRARCGSSKAKLTVSLKERTLLGSAFTSRQPVEYGENGHPPDRDRKQWHRDAGCISLGYASDC